VLLISHWRPFQRQVFQVHFSFVGVPHESSFLVLIFLAFLFQLLVLAFLPFPLVILFLWLISLPLAFIIKVIKHVLFLFGFFQLQLFL